MKKVELLAPAGNMDSLKAAVMAGCDAVYLGGVLFGARAFAGNFTNEEIVDAINYAHLYGVKVYVTINTIIYDSEVERFLDYVRFLHKNNVDAVIIQDIGMFDLLRKKFPNLELHASTQMNIHNYDGALLAKKLGFKRVVMARETPIDVIKKIKEEIDIEIEVFIHGALCVSYSGECLLSALVGKRSGNRGTCAQICRKKYDFYDDDKNKLNTNNYLLSTKDLCTLKYIDKLIEIGVDSLKIEGRMKRSPYVYLVTKTYRKVIDNYYNTGKLKIDENDIIELKKMFNRNFTKGFMLNEDNNNFTYDKRPNNIGIEVGQVISKVKNDLKIKLTYDVLVHDGLRILDDKEDKGLVINKMFMNNKSVLEAKKGDVITLKYDKYVEKNSKVLLTSSKKQLDSISEAIKNQERFIYIDLNFTAKENENLKLTITDGLNTVTEMLDKTPMRAINKETSFDVIKKQLSKLGNTVYKARSITLNLYDNLFINIKDINEIRRRAIRKLNEKRLYKIDFVEKDYTIGVPDFPSIKQTAVLVNKENESLKDKYDLIYTEDEKTKDEDSIIVLPRIINEHPFIKNTVMIGDFGGLLKYDNFQTNFSFNVVNSYSVAFLHSLGAKLVTLSYELSLSQIKNMIEIYKKRYNKNPNTSLIINSYPECFVSKFNLNKKYNVKSGYLKDSYGNFLRVKTKGDIMVVYHFKKVNLYDIKEVFETGVNLCLEIKSY
jgi:putative protease